MTTSSRLLKTSFILDIYKFYFRYQNIARSLDANSYIQAANKAIRVFLKYVFATSIIHYFKLTQDKTPTRTLSQKF